MEGFYIVLVQISSDGVVDRTGVAEKVTAKIGLWPGILNLLSFLAEESSIESMLLLVYNLQIFSFFSAMWWWWS